MGRPQRIASSEFDEWREGFRLELVAEFDEGFAADAMDVLDKEIGAFGEDITAVSFYESTVPPTTRCVRGESGVRRG
jgi:hypothetical protein